MSDEATPVEGAAEEPKPPFDMAKTVDMRHERIFCARHGELFRKNWPSGFLLFALPGIQYLLEQDGYFMQAVKKAQDSGLPFPRAVESVLDEKPVCCRLPSRVLVERYEFAGCQKEHPAFKVSKCFNCRKVAAGQEYKLTVGSTVQIVPHVCIRCVVYEMQPGS